MNPLDDVIEALDIQEEMEKESFAFRPKKPFSQREHDELQMWQTWNSKGRKPNHLRPLVKSLQPLVQHRAKIFQNKLRDIPPAAIEAEFDDRLLDALSTFNPEKGRMKTWVTRNLMKANRFINTYQNPGRIGEKRIYDISKFQNAEGFLRDQLGRSPTVHEIADHAKMPVREAELLRSEVRKAMPIGQLEVDPTIVRPSRTKEVMRLLPYDLTPDENAVFEYVHGVAGKPKLGTNDIAKKMGLSAPKVSRIKSQIATKWRKYDG